MIEARGQAPDQQRMIGLFGRLPNPHTGLSGWPCTLDKKELRTMKLASAVSKMGLLAVFLVAICASAADAPTITVKGYVLDSACAFTKGLSKPISKQCAISCANAGSPLVILAEDGTIYWPIADTTPSSGQNPKLLPFAGDKVTATGKLYERAGSKAIVIEKIEALKPSK
jgi:hypothetical protein